MPTIPEIQVCHERRVALWQTPRCASTTLARWAYEAGFIRFDGWRDPSYTHYAIVRDPYERYLSTLLLRWYHRGHDKGPWERYLERVAAHRWVWTDDNNIHFFSQWMFRLAMPHEVLVPLNRVDQDRKSTRLNSSHSQQSRMPSSA